MPSFHTEPFLSYRQIFVYCPANKMYRLYPSLVRYFFIIIIIIITYLLGDRGSTVVKVLCYKSEGRWFDPSWRHWIFH